MEIRAKRNCIMLIELKRCKPWWFKKEESMKGMKVYKESRKVFVCVCVCVLK